MHLLDRYLYKIFTKHLFLVLSTFVSIYLLVDFFERIDNFTEKHLPLSLAIRYFVCKIPLMIEQVIPVSIMLAGIITVGLLNNSREMQSLQATGIRQQRIIRPVLFCSFFYTITALAASQWLLPPTLAATNSIWYQKVTHAHATGTVRDGKIFYKGKEGFYSFFTGTKNTRTFNSFSYIAWDNSNIFSQQITANQATQTDKKWLLTKGQIKQNAATPHIELFDARTISLPDPPATLFLPEYKNEEQSLSDLWQQGTGDRPNARPAIQQFHARVSYIFLALPLLFIGLPTLLFLHRKWNKDLSLAIPVSCGMAFVVWGIWGVLQSLAKNSLVPVAPAAWGAHLLIILVIALINRKGAHDW